MNAEQKQRAADLLSAWRATAYALHGDRMADLLQELVDAPEVLTATNPAQISSSAEPPADVVRDAERWRMLPAFLDEFQIPYLQVASKIDAAIEREILGGEYE